MQTLHISRQELHTRGGVLDRMLDSLFDTAILVDTDCRILYISASSFPDPSQRAAVVGQHISVLDQLSPFEEVLRTGQPRPDLFLELHGRPCISSLFPVLDGERVIGVVGTITVRNLGRLKKVLSQLSDQAAGFRGLYQDLARVDSGYRLEDFVGESPRVADLLDKARKAAHSGESVLILGETGTGKEIIASGIHAERHGGRPLPYVTINCTAIPEQLLESELFGHEKGAFTGATEARMGKFQLAGDGDILLDEIGDMDLQMQSKLLRVLESREFERVGGREIIPLRAGIIASTNQNLLAMSERRAFRADLYYRLSTIELYLPPLRARPEDIPLLIDRLCAQKGGRLRLTSQAMEYLQRYTWPGNVRQLKNLVGRWLVFYDGVQITGRHVVDELTIGQRSYNEAFGVTDPLAGTESPSGPASAPPPTLADQERAALEQAAAQGAEVVVATGRFYGGIPQELRDLPFLRYFILMNGAKVYDRRMDKTLGRAEIPWETVEAVIDFLEPLHCSVDCFQNDRGLMARKYYDRLEQYVTHPPSFALVKRTREPVDDLKEAVLAGGGSVQKLQAYFPDLELRPKVMEQCKLVFPDLVQAISMPANLEFNAPDATKGNGLRTLCRCLGIDPREAAAFGDGTNDLSLLQEAGIGVAMGNAGDEVKEAADYVTDSVDDDGVMNALRHFDVI